MTQNRNTEPIDPNDQQLSNDSGTVPMFGGSGSGGDKAEQKEPQSHSSGDNQ